MTVDEAKAASDKHTNTLLNVFEALYEQHENSSNIIKNEKEEYVISIVACY